MLMTRYSGFILLAAMFVAGCARKSEQVTAAAGSSKTVPVELQTVKYDGLKSAIQAQKGKIVVMDIWGEF